MPFASKRDCSSVAIPQHVEESLTGEGMLPGEDLPGSRVPERTSQRPSGFRATLQLEALGGRRPAEGEVDWFIGGGQQLDPGGGHGIGQAAVVGVESRETPHPGVGADQRQNRPGPLKGRDPS